MTKTPAQKDDDWTLWTIALSTALTAIFLILRLTGVVHWNWYVVFFPWMFCGGFFIFAVGFLALVLGLGWKD